jgi:hypothetical protein
MWPVPPVNPGRYARTKGKVAEQAVARYLQANGYPLACTARSTVGGMQLGEDILGVPGVSIEVKNRHHLDFGASLRQAAIQGGPDKVAVVVVKPVGVGLDSVGDWWALTYVRHQVPLWPKEGLL